MPDKRCIDCNSVATSFKRGSCLTCWNERVAFYQAQRDEVQRRVRELTDVRPGDTVIIPAKYGRHVAADCAGLVEKIDIEHNHACDLQTTPLLGHTDKCFDPKHLSVNIVWGVWEDDGTIKRATLRCREPLEIVHKIAGKGEPS